MKAKTIEIERSSGNVYADIGLADAGEMLVKARLASKIAEILKTRNLTQMQAADILGLPQPKISDMLSGKFRGISESKMMKCLSRLGSDVQIVVKDAPPSRPQGNVEVVFA